MPSPIAKANIWNKKSSMQLEKEIESLLTSSILKSLDSAQHDSHGTCYAKKSRQSKVYPDSAMTRPIVKSFSSLHPPAAVWWTLNSCGKPVPYSGSTLAGLMVVLRRAKSGSKLRNCTFRTFGGLGLSQNAKYELMIENGVTAILWNGKNTNKETHLCCQKFNP